MVRQEQNVNVAETGKKRWAAPEATRLEFPKTASSSAKHTAFDAAVTYVMMS